MLSVQFSHSVMSYSLWPHELQPARLPFPSPIPGACSNSRPLSRWCHPTISSPVIPFSSCLQSFPVSGSFPMSQFFVSCDQSTGFSFSISPSSEYSGLISFRIDRLDLLAVQGTLKSLLQHHSSKASILQCLAFFMVQLLQPHCRGSTTSACWKSSRSYMMGTGGLWKALCPWDWRLPMESSPILSCLSQLYVQWKQWWMVKSQVCVEYIYPQIKKEVCVGNTYFRMGDSPRRGDKAQRGNVRWWPEEHERLIGERKGSTWRRLHWAGQSTRARRGGLLLLQAPKGGERGEWRSRCVPSHPTRHTFFLSWRTEPEAPVAGTEVYLSFEASEETFSADNGWIWCCMWG